MPKLAPAVRDERRRNILDAAWRRAAVGGFRDVTVDDVCAEAGVSKGAFYVYFPEKRDLLLAMLDEDAASLLATMAALERSRLSWGERLRRLTRAMLRRSQDPARVQVRADLWAAMQNDDEVRARFAEAGSVLRASLRRWIEQAEVAGELAPLPANALAAILVALGDGLMLHAGLDPMGFRWSNIRRAMDALLEGLRE